MILLHISVTMWLGKVKIWWIAWLPVASVDSPRHRSAAGRPSLRLWRKEGKFANAKIKRDLNRTSKFTKPY